MLGKALTTAAAGNAAGQALYVEDVFSTYLYTGNGSTQTITNGIDLDGEGGLVWTKSRGAGTNHNLWDVANSTALNSDNVSAAGSATTYALTANSDGYNLGNGQGQTNSTSYGPYVSWTFRKAPKFFDVVTYTGTGSARTVSHNLGSVPGTIIVKVTDNAGGWQVYHRSTGATKYLVLNETQAAGTSSNQWNNTAPTDSVFTVGNIDTNESGRTYVAYLFAHNDGDGEFGVNADQDIIKCGSFTDSTTVSVDLGFEPQWLLLRASGITSNWWIIDNMRGNAYTSTFALAADTYSAESDFGAAGYYAPTATGFANNGFDFFGAGNEVIYIAIRRGPMKTPPSGTEVFAPVLNGPVQSAGFPVDFTLSTTQASQPVYVFTRLTGIGKYLAADRTNGEASTGLSSGYDNNTGIDLTNWYGSRTDIINWMFRRAPGFFDVVAYEGDGTSGRTVNHNLGVAPELTVVKRRNSSALWVVGSSLFSNPANHSLSFNESSPISTGNYFNSFSQNSFQLGSYNLLNTNNSGSTYIAYLFATVPGVSKVGSYTGNGTSQTIDCGFSAGARFVLIKRTDGTGNWNLFDSERGIVAGNDPRLELNTTDAEDTGYDWIDPDSSGFIVNHIAYNADCSNHSGATYIFLAIA